MHIAQGYQMLATWPEYMFTKKAQVIKSAKETRDVKIEKLDQQYKTIVQAHDAATCLTDVKHEIIVKDEEDDNVTDHFVSNDCDDEVPPKPLPNTPTFYQIKMLDEEPVATISQQNYECKQCNFLYSSADQYRQHEIVHSKGILKCDVCNKNFKYPVVYQRHMNAHNGLANFNCDICRKPYAYQSNYQIHMRLHTTEGSYKCQNCDKIFFSRRGLTVHTRTHRNAYVKRNYECEICGIRFRTIVLIKAHQLIHSKLLFRAKTIRTSNGCCSCLAMPYKDSL